jgi:hypothetical protein
LQANKAHGGGRLRLSLDRFRSAYPEESTNVVLQSRPVESEDGASDDEMEPFSDEALTFDTGTRMMKNSLGEIVTKHDAQRASNK